MRRYVPIFLHFINDVVWETKQETIAVIQFRKYQAMDKLSFQLEIQFGANDLKISQMDVAALHNFVYMILKRKELVKHDS